MPNHNPDLFSTEGRREALHESYRLVAGEIEALAELAAGTQPDDDLADAMAHLACAMKSLAAARDKALKEWAANGGDACFSEAELDKLLGELGKIAREEQATVPDLVTRVYGHMGYDRVDPLANGSADGAVDALEEKP